MLTAYRETLLLLTVLFAVLPLPAEETKDVILRLSGESEESVVWSYEGDEVGPRREGLKAILERISDLPAGTSIVWGPNYDRCGGCSGTEFTPRRGYPDLWAELQKRVRDHGLTLSSAYPGPFPRTSKRAARDSDAQFRIAWQNYRGPETNHEEVLYLANDEYLGRGDDGFAELLERLSMLPADSTISIPRYEYRGRAVLEGPDSEKRLAQNERLAKLAPYGERSDEVDAIVEERELKVRYEYISPGRNSNAVMDWNAGDRYASAVASIGRIVRHDEKPKAAALVLGWKDYETGLSRSPDGNRVPRRPESTATYTINDKGLGKGVTGFAKAMEEFAELPAGSTVQVRVCLRTQGPFVCPLVYENQRHFERTGFEPYVGMFPWLIQVARDNELLIEWLPDEGKTCQDCELNK